MKKILYVIPLLMGLMVVGCGKENLKTKTKEITLQEGIGILKDVDIHSSSKVDLIEVGNLEATRAFSIDFNIEGEIKSSHAESNGEVEYNFDTFKTKGTYYQTDKSLYAKAASALSEGSTTGDSTYMGTIDVDEELFGFTEGENKGRYLLSNQHVVEKLIEKGKEPLIGTDSTMETPLAAVGQYAYTQKLVDKYYESYSKDVTTEIIPPLEEIAEMAGIKSYTKVKTISKSNGLEGINVTVKMPAAALSKYKENTFEAYLLSEYEIMWDEDYNLVDYKATIDQNYDKDNRVYLQITGHFSTKVKEANFDKTKFAKAEAANEEDLTLMIETVL